MKQLKTLAASLILLLAVSACQKNENNTPAAPAPQQTPAPQPQLDPNPSSHKLEGKQTWEVLMLKYDKAELKCQLWDQFAESSDRSSSSAHAGTIDLKSVWSFQTINLKTDNGVFTTSIRIKPTKLTHFTEVDLEYTLNAMVDFEVVATFYAGGFLGSSGNDKSVIEADETQITAFEADLGGQVKRKVQVYCHIETIVKPEFQ